MVYEVATRIPKFVCVDCKIMKSVRPIWVNRVHWHSMSYWYTGAPQIKCHGCGKPMIMVDSRFRPPARDRHVDWSNLIKPYVIRPRTHGAMRTS